MKFLLEYQSAKTIILEGNHLSVTNDIKSLLNIQDENITFEENCVQDEEYKGKICTFA